MQLSTRAESRILAFEPAFRFAFGLAAALALVLTAFVVKPEYAQRLHAALAPEPALVAPVAPVPAAAALLADRGVAPTNRAVERVAARRTGALTPAEAELEIIRRLAAAMESQPVEARPVGDVRMREYRLSNGQRMMVVDEDRPKAVKCVYY